MQEDRAPSVVFFMNVSYNCRRDGCLSNTLENREQLKPREEENTEEQIAIIAAAIDETWYLETNLDVKEAGIAAAVHYYYHGWRENRNPTPNFSTRFYLDANPDVAASGHNPYWHYLCYGKSEGRLPVAPIDPPPSPPPVPETNLDREMVETIRPYVDVEFYRAEYLIDRTTDPSEYFLTRGWKEFHNPSLDFNTAYYLEANPDVRAAEINPLWHYIVAGRAEGRLPINPGGHKLETLKTLASLPATVEQWKRREAKPPLLAAMDIANELRRNRHAVCTGLLISVSHDDFQHSSGGVQLCISHEMAASISNAVTYLHLRPWQPLPRLSQPIDNLDPLVVLKVDGRDFGTAATSTVASAIRQVENDFPKRRVVVHQMLGHAPEAVAQLVRSTGVPKCSFWLHDFFSLCPSFALQRNDISFCGAPPTSSNACTVCKYGVERISHSTRMRAFFDEIEVDLLSPSAATLRFWQRRSDLRVGHQQVLPHMHLHWQSEQAAVEPHTGVTIGFIGYPSAYKGWPVFEKLVKTYGGKGGYRFIYFGNSDVSLANLEKISVHVTSDNADAMVQALRLAHVDFVLHWANCFETFSLSTYEALEASAFIITNSHSGNVAATVNQTRRGVVIDDEASLIEYLGSDEFAELLKAVREKRCNERAIRRMSQFFFDSKAFGDWS